LIEGDLEEADQKANDEEGDDRYEDPPDDLVPKLIFDLLPGLILLSK
jgi:hypothetical protein